MCWFTYLLAVLLYGLGCRAGSPLVLRVVSCYFFYCGGGVTVVADLVVVLHHSVCMSDQFSFLRLVFGRYAGVYHYCICCCKVKA